MENPIDICKRNINSIFETLRLLLEQVGETPLARVDREAINNFEINYKNFNKRITASPPNSEAAISSANGAAIHAQAVGYNISSREIYNEEVRATAKKLQHTASNLREIIDTGEEFTLPYILSITQADQVEPTAIDGSVSNHEKYIIELQAKLRSEIETFERGIAKGTEDIENLKRKSFENSQNSLDEISALHRSVERLESEISRLQENLLKEIGKAEKISGEAEGRSKDINDQIDDLLGQTASKVLLVDYANTAEAEKKSANMLRNLSLGCMALTGTILSFALYESLSSGLDWKQVIFKIFTAVALSVPAAYLARESAKHRSQEHVNRRISLDLRAMTPYIATLSPEEQNKIKSEVASKIFGIQEGGGANSDNYPINFQELAKMLIEKIPTQK